MDKTLTDNGQGGKLFPKLREAWSSLPLKWRKEIASVSHTFFATFGVFIATQVNAGEMMWTKNGLMALGAAAARAALKAAFNAYIASKKLETDKPTM